jgi:hypothetical protein
MVIVAWGIIVNFVIGYAFSTVGIIMKGDTNVWAAC